MTIEVTLTGANGSRTTEVNEPRGLLTRHVKAPREAVPSLFGDVSIKREFPVVDVTPAPQQSLSELLTEVDTIMHAEPKPKPSRPVWKSDRAPSRQPEPKTNWDSPAVKGWKAYQQKKSDERMAYLKRRAEVQA